MLDYAAQIMEARHFGSLVGLIEQLLREEFERRNGLVTLKDGPAKLIPKPQGPVSYKKTLGKRNPAD